MKRFAIVIIASTLTTTSACIVAADAPVAGPDARLDRCNVTWTSPSRDSSGSMPLGNGDIGLNLWVESDGDLMCYLSKTDAWCGTGRLLKLARLRVSLDPNPFRAGLPFRQTLRLRDGEIEIVAGPADHAVTLRIWVDALRPVVHVEAEGATDLVMRVGLEVWRGEPRELAGIDRYVTHRFLHDVPAELAGETCRQCERLGALLPEVPLHTLADPIRLWPAQRFEQLANSENPELYAVFPYRLYGLGRPGVEIGRATFDARGVKRTGGWSQDPIQAALLGLTDIAAAYTYENFRTKHVTLEVVPERRLKDVVLPET